MPPSQASVVLIPGLGADHRLFGPQKRAFTNLRIPEWIEPERGESLERYASRMADSVDEPDRPYVLGGVSMGGMLALEMARKLRPSALVLIGSAKSGREVRSWLRLSEAVCRPLPDIVINAGRSLAPVAAPLFSSAGHGNRSLFLDMLRDTPTSFIRWASRAITAWRPESMPGVPTHRIHGAWDRIIRPPSGSDATIVPRAGHLINLSHAREVNRLIREAAGEGHVDPE